MSALSPRPRVFISHSFSQAPVYLRLLETLEREGFELYNHSIPAWAPLDATESDLEAQISDRIRRCSRIVVLVHERLHESVWVNFEIETAVALGKEVIAVRKHGELHDPLPRAVVDAGARVVSLRGSSLVKAVRGDYPPESRVWDIAEERDRDWLVAKVVAGAVGASFFLLGTAEYWMPRLRDALAARGVEIRQSDGEAEPSATAWTVGGGLLGLLVGALAGGTWRSTLLCGMAGAGLGYAGASLKRRWITVRQLGPVAELKALEGEG